MRFAPKPGHRYSVGGWMKGEDVSDESEEWALLDKLLEKHPPGYERDPSKKIQMLTHLSEIDDPKVPQTIVRYLGDDDETPLTIYQVILFDTSGYCIIQGITPTADADTNLPLFEQIAQSFSPKP